MRPLRLELVAFRSYDRADIDWTPYELVVTRNSCTESSVRRSTEVNAFWFWPSLTSMPSRVTLLWSARAPLTEPYRGSTVVSALLRGM